MDEDTNGVGSSSSSAPGAVPNLQQHQGLQLPIAIAAGGYRLAGGASPQQQQLQQPQHDTLLGPTTSQLPLLANNGLNSNSLMTGNDNDVRIAMLLRGHDGAFSSVPQQQGQLLRGLGQQQQQQQHQQAQQFPPLPASVSAIQQQLEQAQQHRQPSMLGSNALVPLHQLADASGTSPSTPTSLHTPLTNSQILQLLSPQLGVGVGGAGTATLQQQLGIRREMAGAGAAAELLSSLSAPGLGIYVGGQQQSGPIENRFPPTSPAQAATAGGSSAVGTLFAGDTTNGPANRPHVLVNSRAGGWNSGVGRSAATAPYGSGTVRIVSGTGYRHITPFPWRLHEMLQALAESQREHIASWLPGGTSFKVHNPKIFAESVIPAFFKHSQYKSFQRQLHIYGFQRVDSGMHKGAYYHQFFVRDNRYLCQLISRTVSSGNTGPRGKRGPAQSKDENKKEQNVQQRRQDRGDGAPASTNVIASAGKSQGENDDKDQQGLSTPPGSSSGRADAAVAGEAPAPQGAILLPTNLEVSPRLKDGPDSSNVMESGPSLPVPPWAVDDTNATDLGSAKLQQQQVAASSGVRSSDPTANSTSQSSSSRDDKGKSGEVGVASYASEIISLFAGGKPTTAGVVSTGGQAHTRATTASKASATVAANESSPSDQQSNTSWDDIF